VLSTLSLPNPDKRTETPECGSTPGRDVSVTSGITNAIVSPALCNVGMEQSMPRRRYQRGRIISRGMKRKVWVGSQPPARCTGTVVHPPDCFGLPVRKFRVSLACAAPRTVAALLHHIQANVPARSCKQVVLVYARRIVATMKGALLSGSKTLKAGVCSESLVRHPMVCG